MRVKTVEKGWGGFTVAVVVAFVFVCICACVYACFHTCNLIWSMQCNNQILNPKPKSIHEPIICVAFFCISSVMLSKGFLRRIPSYPAFHHAAAPLSALPCPSPPPPPPNPPMFCSSYPSLLFQPPLLLSFLPCFVTTDRPVR